MNAVSRLIDMCDAIVDPCQVKKQSLRLDLNYFVDTNEKIKQFKLDGYKTYVILCTIFQRSILKNMTFRDWIVMTHCDELLNLINRH
jgi:hypothetical protein